MSRTASIRHAPRRGKGFEGIPTNPGLTDAFSKLEFQNLFIGQKAMMFFCLFFVWGGGRGGRWRQSNSHCKKRMKRGICLCTWKDVRKMDDAIGGVSKNIAFICAGLFLYRLLVTHSYNSGTCKLSV